ncbi:protein kinase domain-containing protein [Paenibacillus sp. YYML68]|uniref:serine/threonine protein kinase n=1 Tax=Paenibacillus sp. YYML68 TaxID=2909250 RepID=UPI002492B604|nr:protein kinase [Paenibacillus sp. YYML68]
MQRVIGMLGSFGWIGHMASPIKRFVESWRDYPLRAGTVLLRRYELIKLIGEGSYGLAYLACDLVEGGELVVKQARPSKGALGRELLSREREALLALGHPSIPRCRGLFEEGGRLFAAIDKAEGRTLEALIFEQQRGFTEVESLAIIARLLPIVGFVHERGWVHLDLRIPNVLLQADGSLALIDFGLARRIGDWTSLVAFTDEEEARRRAPEVQSDLYALGHFLLFLLYSSYEAQEGQPPREWHEELSLSEGTRCVLRRLLLLAEPYRSVGQLREDIEQLLHCEW